MSKRMTPDDRKASILAAAVKAAETHGYAGFRLTHVATLAECSTALVMIYYKTMAQVRRDVMRAAIREKRLPIIAAGLAINDPYCKRITPELRARAAQSLAG